MPRSSIKKSRVMRPRRSGVWTQDVLIGRRDRRSWRIGVLGTILAHLLIVEAWILVPDPKPLPYSLSPRQPLSPVYDVTLVPPESETLPPPNFVEINPDAPDNPPDQTENSGAQNQQVAQPEPSPDSESDKPAVDGDKEIDTTAIVSGDDQKPVVQLASPPPVAEAKGTDEALANAAELSLEQPSGSENLLGEADDAPGSTTTSTDSGKPAGAPDTKSPTNATLRGNAVRTGQFVIDPNKPMPRPTLAAVHLPSKARKTPVMQNDIGTRNIGALAYDAKWSNYGEYLQRFIEVVDLNWKQLVNSSLIYPASGTKVTVRFKMNSKGEISEILGVNSNGGKNAEAPCVAAISERSPYGPWSDDMIAVLGDSQELSFSFLYQ